jgi:FkbH-like protein
MTFLQAHKTLAGFTGGKPLPFLLGMSGIVDPLCLFVRAAAARRGRDAVIRSLPFNTLAQTWLTEPEPGERELFVLLPWDLAPEADWRSGIPPTRPTVADLHRDAERRAVSIASRHASLLYVPAVIPPVLSHPAENAALSQWLLALACSLHARVLPAGTFSLDAYLSSGCPFGGASLGTLAEAITELASAEPTPTRKVLVTDLDNVLWGGVIAEDGMDGIAFTPDGAGYRHFIYQSLLARLERDGVLLCAVSRNDSDAAFAPLRGGRMSLGVDDFVTVLASYEPKSVQIEQLAADLNLGLDSFVFVDDNPLELAEVSARLAAVRCLQFPPRIESMPAFCDELTRLFGTRTVTAEDANRTEYYRRRVSPVPARGRGADLTTFLADLHMRLTIHDRSRGDRTRVVQLINKTNQFNLNGRRLTDQDIDRVLALGGRLYGATLDDRHGSHGEILACLITFDGVIRSFVLSCRVFQRRVEHAFLAWLAGQPDPPRLLDFAATPRNEPFQRFLDDPAFGSATGEAVGFHSGRFAASHAGSLTLFELSAPAGAHAVAAGPAR